MRAGKTLDGQALRSATGVRMLGALHTDFGKSIGVQRNKISLD